MLLLMVRRFPLLRHTHVKVFERAKINPILYMLAPRARAIEASPFWNSGVAIPVGATTAVGNEVVQQVPGVCVSAYFKDTGSSNPFLLRTSSRRRTSEATWIKILAILGFFEFVSSCFQIIGQLRLKGESENAMTMSLGTKWPLHWWPPLVQRTFRAKATGIGYAEGHSVSFSQLPSTVPAVSWLISAREVYTLLLCCFMLL